jgi:predicted metal-binding protein
MNTYKAYIDKALRMKARAAKVIDAETIVVAQWVLAKCRFGCPGYGDRLTCPPYSPTPDQTQKMIDAYKAGLLIHGGENTPINRIAVKLEKRMFLDGHEKAFAMGAGPCFLCEDCPVESGQCKYPEEARPSMEACGIDVFSTVKAHGFPLEVLKGEDDEPNYYALVLIE